MDWLKSHWRALLTATCTVAGAASTLVPALVPVAIGCAIAVPVVTQAKSWKDALAGVMEILGPKTPTK